MKRETVLLAEYIIVGLMIVLCVLAAFGVFTWGYYVAAGLLLPLAFFVVMDVRNTLGGGISLLRKTSGKEDPAPRGKQRAAPRKKQRSFWENVKASTLYRLIAGIFAPRPRKKKKARVAKAPRIPLYRRAMESLPSLASIRKRITLPRRVSVAKKETPVNCELCVRLVAGLANLGIELDAALSKPLETAEGVDSVVVAVEAALNRAREESVQEVARQGNVESFQAKHYLGQLRQATGVSVAAGSGVDTLGDALLAFVQERNSSIRQLTEDNARLEEELGQVEQARQQLAQAGESQKSELASQLQGLDQLGRELEELQRQLRLAQETAARVQPLETQLAHSGALNEDLSQKLAAADQSVEKLSVALDRKKEQYNKLRESSSMAADQAAADIAGLKQELELLKTRIEITQRGDSSKRKVRVIGQPPAKSAEVKLLEQQLREAVEKAEGLEQQLSSLGLQFLICQQLLDSSQALEDEISQIKDRCRRFEALVNSLINQIDYDQLNSRLRREILSLSENTVLHC